MSTSSFGSINGSMEGSPLASLIAEYPGETNLLVSSHSLNDAKPHGPPQAAGHIGDLADLSHISRPCEDPVSPSNISGSDVTGGTDVVIANDTSRSKSGSENAKKARYQRRLALNRQSAAVSRLRRRQYLSDLESRLARVEAEKYEVCFILLPVYVLPLSSFL